MISGFADVVKRLLPAPCRPAARRVYHAFVSFLDGSSSYEARKRHELRFFTQARAQELPPIAHYWSNKYLVPILEPFGFTNAVDCFCSYLATLCRTHPDEVCSFLSIGAGNCETETKIARSLLAAGLHNFHFECIDINDAPVQTLARRGIEQHISVSVVDVNDWQPVSRYYAVLALQSLHHIVKLEDVFERISDSLHEEGYFLTDDMIGRNGHRRWPEALRIVEELWGELPAKYKYNHQLQRFEERFDNWDCSSSGFEGIRAQDVLPLLLHYFHFELFIGFGNLIDVFIDRSFGHNFDPKSEWDRAFIDRVHALDVGHLEAGEIKPTHMIAVLTKKRACQTSFHKHLSPEYCIRAPLWKG